MKKLFPLLLLFTVLFFVGCKDDENPVNGTDDIPADPTNVTVPQTTINNITPTAVFAKNASNPSRISMNLTGIINPVSGQAVNLVAQQNLFVQEDGTVKGLKVSKVGGGTTLNADVVFTIDNSGSMDQEADSVAASIIKFAQKLQASGLNVQFACVGYWGDINGAINFTNAQTLENYLNRYTGTSRTEGFSGPDSAKLEDSSYTFGGPYDENGAAAVLYANKFFSWRTGAQRVFINFTDEPTQPGGEQQWSTENMCQVIGGSATVHTVWSGGDTTYYSWTPLQDERPWDMSKCTGGTVVFVDQYANGLDLSNLPVTGALSNSYLVEYVTSNPNGTHTVVITVKDGTSADGKRTYTITY